MTFTGDDARSLLDRFLRYVRVWTTSAPNIGATPSIGAAPDADAATTTPSTPGQWDLARMLEKELRDMGIDDVEVTEHCYVLARLPATAGAEDAKTIGFLAHLDTASDVSGRDVRPVVEERYDGRVLTLAGGAVLDPKNDAALAASVGKTIIHSDGNTLLGAADKAGIAILMNAAAWFRAHPETAHPSLEFIFTPDEETGRGLPCFPREKVRSAFCYTVDGGGAGEFEAECFNAWSAVVTFSGRVYHPGHARGLLVNAALMAAAFAALLPRNESPEATDGYYGYYCLMDMRGNQETASMNLLLRDFEEEGMRRRLAALESFACAVEAQFPGGTVTVTATDSYRNMKEKIAAVPEVMEKLKKAAEAAGAGWTLKPIRGGTDGSRLTELGIPTPNIFTGGYNFHSRAEWASLDEMVKACEVVIELASSR
jgi:tripeptide aminopeptidase